ncbi:MAG: DUF2634 domain-containing protein [Peptococcaceae bacterium]|nr:DUF2634 domain-containing protein [Peptococcaceae bacterium]
MPNLFSTDALEENPYAALGEEESEAVGYRPGIAFDYETDGDFVRDGRHRVQESTGIESWQSWVINCLSTERYKHLAYSTDFGIEYDKIFAASNQAEAESILVRQITEALLADPYGRTSYVEITDVNWLMPGAVIVVMTLHGVEDVTVDMTLFLTGGKG